MADWTAHISTEATPEQVLEVLTHPEEIRRWSPVDFDLEDLRSSRLTAGTRTRVTGKLAGVSMGFDVEVKAADEAGLELSAHVPPPRAAASPAGWWRTPPRRCSPRAPSTAPPDASPARPRPPLPSHLPLSSATKE